MRKMIFFPRSVWASPTPRARLTLALALLAFATPAHADIYLPPGGGGSSTLTSGSTATSGFAAGSLLYSNGALLQSLGIGSNGQYLGVSGGVLAWSTPSGSGTISSCAQYSVGVYLATGTTINCSANLTLNGATLAIGNVSTVGTLQIYGASFYSQLLAGTAANVAYTLPPSAGPTSTLVDTATAQSLSNKTFGSGSVWQGGVIGATYGGTGVNNGASTITLGGSLTFSGAFTFSGTLTGATAVTFPTSGTLLANPMTTAGDLILGGASGAATRLAIGGNGTCLTSNGTTASWGACGSGSPGGSTTQLQFNNAGAFGGAAALTWSSPTLTIGVQGVTLGQLALASSAAFTTTLASSASQTASYTLTWPTTAGSASQCLQNGATPGVLTFGACGGVASLAVGTTSTSGGAAGQIMYDGGALLQENANLIVDTTNFAYDAYRNCSSGCGTNGEEVAVGFTSTIVATGNQTANTPTAILQVTKNGTGAQRNFGLFVGPTSATANILLDYGLATASTLTFGYNGTFDVCMTTTGWCWSKSTRNMMGASNRAVGWTSSTGTPTSSSLDTTLCRLAAGVVEVGSGTGCATNGTLRAQVVGTPTGYTVSTLPTGTAGDRTYVTDQTTSCPAVGAALAGGGAVVCPVFYNGTAWVGG